MPQHVTDSYQSSVQVTQAHWFYSKVRPPAILLFFLILSPLA